jgi:hypothetical protein
LLIGASKLPLRILQASTQLGGKIKKIDLLFLYIKLEKPQKKKQIIKILYLRISPFLMWNKGYMYVYIYIYIDNGREEEFLFF